MEIGPGTGVNFEYYPRGSEVTCVEPNEYFQTYVQSHSEQFQHVTVKAFIIEAGEDMKSVGTGSMDVVIATHVLCGVDNVKKVFAEIKRVLKPVSKIFNICICVGFTVRSGSTYVINSFKLKRVCNFFLFLK